MYVFIKKSLRRSGKRRKIHRTEFLLSLYLFSFVIFLQKPFFFFFFEAYLTSSGSSEMP